MDYLILFVLFIILIIGYNYYTHIENFDPWMNFEQPSFDLDNRVTYNDCMLQGYGDDFCSQTTAPNYRPGVPEGRCKCVGGTLGSFQRNGKCFCYIHDDANGEYTQKLFTSYTAEGEEWLKNVEAYGRKDTMN